MKTHKSSSLLESAKDSLPGGVNSTVRVDIDGDPISFEYGKGSKIVDVDGNEFIDYLCAWGPIILGHCDEELNDRVASVLDEQDLFGLGSTQVELDAARAIKERVPSADKVLFGVTGSEVTARAIRLARGVTGRDKIIKFQGHYHGWYDPLCLNVTSDESKLGQKDPLSDGLGRNAVDDSIVLPFNDVNAVEETVREHGDDIAAMILEPVAHNMGCVVPKEGYLQELRRISDENDIVLIFDEVITGFRHDIGGVQKLEGVTPDLTTMGKAVANGYPVSVLCGKDEYMSEFTTSDGSVRFAGTYNGHAGSMAAVVETIRLLEERSVHDRTFELRKQIANGIEDLIEDIGLNAQVLTYGNVFATYFVEGPVNQYKDVLRGDVQKYKEYRREMIERGVMMVPNHPKRNYLTGSHSEADIQRTLDAADEALRVVADSQ